MCGSSHAVWSDERMEEEEEEDFGRWKKYLKGWVREAWKSVCV